MTSVKEAARRLIKSQLRGRILQALVVARPQQDWQSAVEVEAGITEEAFEAWEKVRAWVTPSDDCIQEAFEDAALAVVSAFEHVVPNTWLDEQVLAYRNEMDLHVRPSV